MTSLRTWFCLTVLSFGVANLGCGEGAEDGTLLSPSENEEEAVETPLAPQPGDDDFVRNPALNVENISAHGLRRSHNARLNCIGCHQERGPGRGLFTAAGTLHDADGMPHPNGTVRLRTSPGPDGVEVAVLQGDANGNFYTTESLPVPEVALFITVESSDGLRTKSMPFPTTTLSCNLCHTGGFRVRLP